MTLGVVAIAAASCRKPAAEEVESETPVPVKTEMATAGSIRGLVHATGMVNPAPDAELVVIAPEAARIADIPKAEGDRVMKGDLLVRFEIPTLAADVQRQGAEVQRAQAALANAKANQTRARELFDRGIAARKEVEDGDRQVADAEAGVAQAEASRAAALAAAARVEVRASFNGVIAKRFHNPGDLVEASAGDPVLRVIDPRRLEVAASVPINDSSRIVVGAAARLSGASERTPDATLKVVSRPTQVEAGTATIPVRLAFAAPTNLPVGTPVQVDIDAELHTNAVLIPASALVREAEETAVFVVDGDKARRRPVQLGLADSQRIEVVSGLKAGEMVIIEGQAGLPDGAEIAIDKPDGTPATDAADGKDDEK